MNPSPNLRDLEEATLYPQEYHLERIDTLLASRHVLEQLQGGVDAAKIAEDLRRREKLSCCIKAFWGNTLAVEHQAKALV